MTQMRQTLAYSSPRRLILMAEATANRLDLTSAGLIENSNSLGIQGRTFILLPLMVNG